MRRVHFCLLLLRDKVNLLTNSEFSSSVPGGVLSHRRRRIGARTLRISGSLCLRRFCVCVYMRAARSPRESLGSGVRRQRREGGGSTWNEGACLVRVRSDWLLFAES